MFQYFNFYLVIDAYCMGVWIRGVCLLVDFKSVHLVAVGECINNFFREKGNHIMTCLEMAYVVESINHFLT